MAVGYNNHMIGSLDAFISLVISDMSKLKMGDENVCEEDGRCFVKLNSYGWNSIKKCTIYS